MQQNAKSLKRNLYRSAAGIIWVTSLLIAGSDGPFMPWINLIGLVGFIGASIVITSFVKEPAATEKWEEWPKPVRQAKTSQPVSRISIQGVKIRYAVEKCT